MTTSKPKVQGYVSQWLAEQFEAERERWDLTQSQALERILSERYNIGEQVRTDGSSTHLSLRLSSLESTVEQLQKDIAALKILKITSNLNSDTVDEQITSNPEGDTVDEQITSNPEGDTLDEQITSNLDSDTVDEQITSNLDSDTVDEQITSNLDSDTVDEQITSNLDSDTVDEQITSNLDSDTVDEQITSNLDSDTVDEQITSNLDSDTVDEQITSNLEKDYQWLTFEEAWTTLPTPKPKDWDDGEQGMLKTRAKRRLRESHGSEHWTKFSILLFRTIGFELEPGRGDRCLRKLPEPIPHVWNLYDSEGLVEGGFRRKADAQTYCRNCEDKESVSKLRWEYEPAQLNLVE